MKVIVLKDTLSPALHKMLERMRNRAPLMSAIGQRAISRAKDAFTDASIRPSPWPAKKTGQPATLYKTGALKQSPRLVAVDGNSVTVGSDRPYAAIHQLGGRTSPHTIKPKNGKALLWMANGQAHFAKSVKHPGSLIPARPYFPMNADGSLEPEFDREVSGMVRRHVLDEGKE